MERIYFQRINIIRYLSAWLMHEVRILQEGHSERFELCVDSNAWGD